MATARLVTVDKGKIGFDSRIRTVQVFFQLQFLHLRA